MVSEGPTKKLADLESSMLLDFFRLIEADEDSTPSIKLQ